MSDSAASVIEEAISKFLQDVATDAGTQVKREHPKARYRVDRYATSVTLNVELAEYSLDWVLSIKDKAVFAKGNTTIAWASTTPGSRIVDGLAHEILKQLDYVL